MSDLRDDIQGKFEEMNEKLGTIQIPQLAEISEDGVNEFCRGFELFILGSFHFIQDNTNSHQDIFITVSGDQITTYERLTSLNFKEFTDQQKRCLPPSSIDFKFILSRSIYPIGDISETVNVYLNKGGYEIVYEYGNDQEFRVRKAYMTYIEPDEIRKLRDLVSQSIIKKVSVKIDELE